MKKRSLIPIAKNPKGVTLKSERQTLQIAFLFPLFLSLLIGTYGKPVRPFFHEL